MTQSTFIQASLLGGFGRTRSAGDSATPTSSCAVRAARPQEPGGA